MHPVPLASRERADLLLLIGPHEHEFGDIAAGVDGPFAELDRVVAAGDLLEDRLVRVERVATLVDVSHVHGGTHADGPGVGLLLAHEHPEERRLAGAVRTDDPHDAARRQPEREVLEEQLVTEALREVLRIDHLVAEGTARRDEDLDVLIPHRRLLRRELLVGRHAGLALRLTGLRRHPDPLELLRERLLAGGGLLLLELEPRPLLLEPRRIVALEGDAAAMIDLEDPLRDVVEEVPVVGHRHDGALVFGEVSLEPVDTLRIEVIRGLVEQQEIGLLQQEPAEGNAPPLPAGEVGDGPVARRQVHRVHRDLHLPVEIPRVFRLDLVLHGRLLGEQLLHLRFVERLAEPGVDLLEAGQDRLRAGDRLHDVLEHGLVGIQFRLLREIPRGIAVGQPRLTFELTIEPRHDLHERALARPVAAEQPDLGPGIEGEIDVLEELALAELLGQVRNLKDERGSHRKRSTSVGGKGTRPGHGMIVARPLS